MLLLLETCQLPVELLMHCGSQAGRTLWLLSLPRMPQPPLQLPLPLSPPPLRPTTSPPLTQSSMRPITPSSTLAQCSSCPFSWAPTVRLSPGRGNRSSSPLRPPPLQCQTLPPPSSPRLPSSPLLPHHLPSGLHLSFPLLPLTDLRRQRRRPLLPKWRTAPSLPPLLLSPLPLHPPLPFHWGEMTVKVKEVPEVKWTTKTRPAAAAAFALSTAI